MGSYEDMMAAKADDLKRALLEFGVAFSNTMTPGQGDWVVNEAMQHFALRKDFEELAGCAVKLLGEYNALCAEKGVEPNVGYVGTLVGTGALVLRRDEQAL